LTASEICQQCYAHTRHETYVDTETSKLSDVTYVDTATSKLSDVTYVDTATSKLSDVTYVDTTTSMLSDDWNWGIASQCPDMFAILNYH